MVWKLYLFAALGIGFKVASTGLPLTHFLHYYALFSKLLTFIHYFQWNSLVYTIFEIYSFFINSSKKNDNHLKMPRCNYGRIENVTNIIQICFLKLPLANSLPKKNQMWFSEHPEAKALPRKYGCDFWNRWKQNPWNENSSNMILERSDSTLNFLDKEFESGSCKNQWWIFLARILLPEISI